MTLKDQMKTDVSLVFLKTSEFARSVTYTPKGGAPVAINAIWRPDGTEPAYEPTTEEEVYSGTLHADAADVPTPGTRDKFTIDSVVWSVRAIGRVSDMVELQLERKVVITATAQPIRRNQ